MSFALVTLAACSSRFEGYEGLADLAVCDPGAGPFTLEIDNSFFPLPVGQVTVLEGEESGSHLLVRITVLDETETVAGVETRVVEEYEASDDRVVEISRNFYAQAPDGTVCYFGEDVDMFDSAGNVTAHSGAWRAGADDARPGIIMPGSLEVGMAFQQESAPGVAEDQSRVVALDEPTDVPAGTFVDTVTMLDGNPLDGDRDRKAYAADVGLIVDGPAAMTSFSAAQ